MALAVANGSTGNNTGSTTTATTTSRNTSGNTGSGFVCGFAYDSARTLTFSADSAGNQYTQIGTTITDATSATRWSFFRCLKGVGSATHTVTGTLDSNGFITAVFAEITTGGGGLALDGTATQANDTATPFTPGSITTTAGTAMLISMLGGNSTANPATHAESTGFSIITNADFNNGAVNWPLVLGSRSVTPAAYNPSWTETSGTRSGVFVVGFSEVPTGGAQRILLPLKSGPTKLQPFRPVTRAYTSETIGALTGAISINISPVGAMTGTGALTGVIGININPVGAMTGTGALTGAISISFAPVGALTGTGNMAGAVTVLFAPVGALTGTGNMTGTVAVNFDVTSTLDAAGGGAMSGAIPINVTVVGALTGTGALSGAVAINFDPAGTLTDASGTPVTPPVTGGGVPSYSYYNDLDAARQRRLARRAREKEREAHEHEIQDELDRRVAEALYEQELKDAEREDLARIQKLADALMRQKTELPRPVLASVIKAHEERSRNALEQLERVVAQMLEEEEAVIAAVLLLDD